MIPVCAREALPRLTGGEGTRECWGEPRRDSVQLKERKLIKLSEKVTSHRKSLSKSACLEGPILEAHIGTLHSPAVSHLLSDTTFPQLGILRVPLFVPRAGRIAADSKDKRKETPGLGLSRLRDRPQLRLRANKLPSPNHCEHLEHLECSQ